eukprot:scaffold17.g475.t1
MIIVEPRTHPRLRVTLDLYLNVTPSHWKLYVVHGFNHSAHAHEAAKAWYDAGRQVFLQRLPSDNLDPWAYSRLLKNRSFWEGIDAEHILTVQTDTVPCRSSQFTVADFAVFPYIGCNNEDRVGKNAYVHWRNYSFYGELPTCLHLCA